jgi:arylsulfatase A
MKFMRITLFLITLFVADNTLVLAQKNVKKPNIIFILADDLGYGDVGCYGQQKIATPNIDKLAKQGLKFTQFYAGTAVCSPSRASLMTGLHTGHVAVRGNRRTPPEGQYPLPAAAKTFVSQLKQQGYTTAAFGKWGLGGINSTGDPLSQGFDKFYGYIDQTLAHNYYPDHLWDNHTRVELGGNLKLDSVYSADLIHQQAMQFLKAKHTQPFFAYLTYTLPHADVIVPHDSVYNFYVKKFNEKAVEIKSGDNEQHHFDNHPHAAFAAMVAKLDKQVGDVMKAVEQLGIAKNTLIIFSSDNGPHRENGGDPDFFNSSGPLRGIKRDMYEGGIRVPTIAVWQGRIKPGVSRQVGAFWDFFPTFQELAGATTSKQVDGISILPTLLGQKNQQQHKYYYWEFHESGGRQGVLKGDWKAIRLNVSTDPNSPIELYNLKTDLSEKNNIASQHPDIVKDMEAIMKEAHVASKDWPLLYSEIKE